MRKGPSPSRRPGRPPADSVEVPTADRILQVAARCFIKSGFDSVSMSDVADQAGVTKAVLYYYYASKAELFLRSLLYVMEIARQRTVAILESSEPLLSRLEKLTRTRLSIDVTLDMNVIMRGSEEILSPEQLGELRSAEERLVEVLANAFEEEMRAGSIRKASPEFIARAFLSLLVIGRGEMERLGATADVQAITDEVVSLLWYGLRDH
ncbi:TetR family transcriptional regulator [Alicyclobacillus sacchari]|uniref:TetR family transcriptional regulator n=2 Tax=Alicyclobacillus sacchari TaxID=392010 RepID=A0A4R8LPE3_9BACL|nr:TetR/AcrR family transcriptional regulator [Alicyclobacillus sacchari]TDY46293.1 TetR family transcriptional regulator [Alicyclobacillus sacchari]